MPKCFFCGGSILDDYCLHCGRSTDIEYELKTMELQKKDHENYGPRRDKTPGKKGKRNRWEEDE